MDILMIEGCNFLDFPVGGQLSFARQLMQAFPSRIGLVGISTNGEPEGRWFRKKIDGIFYQYFSVGHRIPSSKKPLIPARLQFFLQLKKFRHQIMMVGCENVFIQSPETLLAVQNWSWKSICYRFAGVENPLSDPRYLWGKMIARYFEYTLFKALAKVDVILACADSEAIDKLKDRGGELLDDIVIQKFPTRVDTSRFFPASKSESRKLLGISQDIPVIVNCGRLNQVKGWDLLIRAFAEFVKKSPEACFYFVGDGESRPEVETLVIKLGLKDKVKMTGYVTSDIVAVYLNSCDLSVVGSYKEGWSLAMLEALACGKALVSTEVSGARELISEGINGFIVNQRNPQLFSQLMLQALELPEDEVQSKSSEIASYYTLDKLALDLGSLWPPLSKIEQ